MSTRARARAARPTAIVPRRGVGAAREGAADGRARAIARMSRVGARRGVRRARRREREGVRRTPFVRAGVAAKASSAVTRTNVYGTAGYRARDENTATARPSQIRRVGEPNALLRTILTDDGWRAAAVGESSKPAKSATIST